MKIKVDISAMLATLIILYCNGGMLSFFKGSAIVTFFIYGVLLLWLLLVFIKNRKYIMQVISVCLCVMAFLLIICLLHIIADVDALTHINKMTKNIVFLLIFVTIFGYYCESERKTGRRFILWAWGIDTVIASIYTIYRLMEIPTLSRILATESPEVYLADNASIAGVLGFGSIYGLVFIVVAIIGITKDVQPMHKVCLICCLALFLYTVLQAQFFIASMLCLIGVVLAVLLTREITKRKLFFAIVLLPLLFILVYVLSKEMLPLLVSSEKLPHFISERLVLFINGISINELLLTARGIVYTQSLSAIISTCGVGIIIIGSGVMTGGHSEILDLIAVYGMPLAILLMIGINKIKVFICHSIPETFIRNYNIVWVLFIIMSLLNTSLWCQTTISLFLIIPLAYIEVESQKKEAL